jgi:hypothetical protein
MVFLYVPCNMLARLGSSYKLRCEEVVGELRVRAEIV